jgi:hypothetical protein
MKKKNIYLIVFVSILASFSILVFAYIQNRCVLEGRYIISPKDDLCVRIMIFTLFDKNGPVNDYTFRLKNDGSFRIGVKERGEFYLMQTGESYPTYSPEKRVFSNEDRPYFYKFEKGKSIKLDDIYISKLIKIESPKENEKYRDPNELTFRWSAVPFADLYSLHIVKVTNSGDREIILSTHRIDSNSVSYKDIRNKQIIEETIDYNDLKKATMFNRVNKPINSGEYELMIDAYKYYYEKKYHLLLSHTDNSKHYYFYID